MKYKQKSSSEETTQIPITNPEPLTHSPNIQTDRNPYVCTNPTSQHSSQAKAKQAKLS